MTKGLSLKNQKVNTNKKRINIRSKLIFVASYPKHKLNNIGIIKAYLVTNEKECTQRFLHFFPEQLYYLITLPP
jgi:hypothetical protein